MSGRFVGTAHAGVYVFKRWMLHVSTNIRIADQGRTWVKVNVSADGYFFTVRTGQGATDVKRRLNTR